MMQKKLFSRTLSKLGRRSFSNDAYIVAATRTPVASFQKSLASVSVTTLGATVIRDILNRSTVDPSLVDEVFMGHVCQANVGQAPARQAALGGGLPESVPCTTVNKVCASGMKSITLAAQSIMTKQNSCVIAGGMESMSNIPFYMPKARTGTPLGHVELLDGLLK